MKQHRLRILAYRHIANLNTSFCQNQFEFLNKEIAHNGTALAKAGHRIPSARLAGPFQVIRPMYKRSIEFQMPRIYPSTPLLPMQCCRHTLRRLT